MFTVESVFVWPERKAVSLLCAKMEDAKRRREELLKLEQEIQNLQKKWFKELDCDVSYFNLSDDVSYFNLSDQELYCDASDLI